MSTSISNVNKIKPGTCPHGCSPSACPICSNMGGSSLRAGERPQKAGEMSYHECAIIGAIMKARREAKIQHERSLQEQAQTLKTFASHLEAATVKLADLASKLSNNVILKPAAFVISRLIIPTINTLKNITLIINNTFSKLSELKIDIQDKLNAIFGEIKSFIEKKVSELVSNFKQKFTELFKIFKRSNTKDDETKIDEDKKLFRLKTFIMKIWKREKNGDSKN